MEIINIPISRRIDREKPMIEMKDVNKEIRAVINPFMKDHGFTIIKGKNFWVPGTDRVRMMEIRAVGAYFSEISGWPSMSLTAWLGMFYVQYADSSYTKWCKHDEMGNLFPREWQCQVRAELQCTLDQARHQKNLEIKQEKMRTDIWWVDRDGSNLSEVVRDIRNKIESHGLNWFEQKSDQAYIDSLSQKNTTPGRNRYNRGEK